MNEREALAFVEAHGVVLLSGKGPVPSLTEAIAGGPIRGSWWAHPDSHRIFALIQTVSDAADVVTCRLVDGKITLVHRRLWPALARVGATLEARRVAKVVQRHTERGHHENEEIPLDAWIPADVARAAAKLSIDEARAALGPIGSSSAKKAAPKRPATKKAAPKKRTT